MIFTENWELTFGTRQIVKEMKDVMIVFDKLGCVSPDERSQYI